MLNRNCLQHGSLEIIETDWDEVASFIIFGCLDEDYEYVQTKSMSSGNEQETQEVKGQSRIPDFTTRNSQEDFFTCFPIPMNTEIEIRSSDKELENVRIVDQAGKIVITFEKVFSGQRLDVRHLSAGVYVLTDDTDLGERRAKLLKE